LAQVEVPPQTLQAGANEKLSALIHVVNLFTSLHEVVCHSFTGRLFFGIPSLKQKLLQGLLEEHALLHCINTGLQGGFVKECKLKD
jgi:hypothetical protein